MFTERKTLPIALMLLTLCLAVAAHPLQAADVTVPGDYSSLNEAVAKGRDVNRNGRLEIQVGKGVYSEFVTIRRSHVEISGVSRRGTVLRSGPQEMFRAVVLIDGAMDVTIQNLLIDAEGTSMGLELKGTSGCVARNLALRGGDVGLRLRNSTGDTLLLNQLRNQGTGGIVVGRSTGTLIVDNLVHGSRGFGIRLAASKELTLDNNSIVNSQGNGLSALRVSASSLNQNTIIGSGGSGVALDTSTGIRLTGNLVSSGLANGVVLSGSDSNTITGNTVIENARFGVVLERSFDNDFLALEPGPQPPPGDNDLGGNVQGPWLQR